MAEYQEPKRKEVVMSEKVVADQLNDGMTIAIGGFGTANHPMPIVREIIKRNIKNLTVIGSATAGLEIDMLIGAGCVKKLIAPYVGAKLYAPIGNCYRAAVENNEIEVWECSEYILYAGLTARAMGQEFFCLAWRCWNKHTGVKQRINCFQKPTW